MVVDSVKNPTCVIGIADGIGGILRHEEEATYNDTKEKIKTQLIADLYNKKYHV